MAAMSVGKIESPPDECFRCGYDLRGIANDRPCPECGLAAERSRRVTDELHETRPKWLRSITIGALLILVSVLLTGSWPFCAQRIIDALPESISYRRWSYTLAAISGLGAAAAVFLAGVLLLARSEGYPAADYADRWLRRSLRLAALVPLITFALVCVSVRTASYDSQFSVMLAVGAAANAPLPLLLFLRLRGLAKRVRSAHLTEHCVIVGIGTTAAVLCLVAEGLLVTYAEKFAAAAGLRPNWDTNSTVLLVIVLVFNLTVCLFLLWSIYLLLRFVIAFARAAFQASRKWKRDDHALPRLSP